MPPYTQMPRILYTHKKGELGKLKRAEAKKPAALEAKRLDAIARKTQASASQTASEHPTLRKPNVPERRR